MRTFAEMNEHEPTAANIARHRMHYGKREARRDSRIHSIATFFQHFDTRIRGQMMDADDHRMLRADWSFIACRKAGIHSLLCRQMEASAKAETG
jgi:hypothetical protein